MAITAIQTVLNYELPPREKLVLLVYANYADNNGGGVWPSVATMCSKTGYKQAAIRNTYKVLEAVGLLERVGISKHQTIIWKINLRWEGTREDIESATAVARRHSSTPARHWSSTPPSYRGSNDPLDDKLVNTVENEPPPITPYAKLLAAFINSSKQPVLDVGKKDNEALLKMVEAECLPEDVEAAVAYSTDNGLPMSGPSSVLRGTIIAMGKRKREGSRRAPSKLGNRPFPKEA